MITVVLSLSLTLFAGLVQAGNSNIAGKAPPSTSPKATLAGVGVTGTQTIGAVGSCSRVDIQVTGEITGTTDRGDGMDQIRISVWDDGDQMTFVIVSVPAGSTVALNESLGFDGQYGVGFPGVGIVINDGPDVSGTLLFNLDPFEPDDIVGTCATAAATATKVPALNGINLTLLLMLFARIGFRVVRR